MHTRRRVGAWNSARAVLIAAALAPLPAAAALAGSAPPTLHDTGLYVDADGLTVDPKHIEFAPQYPLWTDGATKRRWLSLPPGSVIDGSDPEAWVFPAGTRLWKEFSFGGRRIETRFMERQADGSWRYAAYTWSADGRDAALTPTRGQRNAYPLGGGRTHTIPGVSDCKVCHQGGRSEVLGFSALQLSRDRDPGALHAAVRPGSPVDLDTMIENGLLVGLPASVTQTPPRIATVSPMERAALGYLHGNCGHCHNDQGSLKNLGLFLRQVSGAAGQPAVATTVDQPMKKPAPGQSGDAVLRIEPGRPDRSALLQRMASRYPALQMPPLGTELADRDAVTLLQRWVAALDTFHNPHEKEPER